MGKKLVSRVKFAESCGVNPSAVTRACAPGKALAAACEGKRIDANHPDALTYRRKRQEAAVAAELGVSAAKARKIAERVSPAVPAEPTPWPSAPAPPPAPTAAPPIPEADEVPPEIAAFADMTLRELIRRHGTDIRFLDWLKALKEIEIIQEKRLRNAERSGELVSVQLVRDGVIDVFNTAHLRIMGDGAKKIASGVKSKALAGATTQELQDFVADVLASFLNPVKNKVVRTLRNAK